ncbi:hypothetical protein DEU56DRAFT_258800 [Suillus clintonianus]|uniref:uncharacterized protein n=1 Tax=Suillus clintonianus TaxID=1904413 RepID=UPI001B87BD73|nr:uncharacterized protein DEU56DRAFT_258800 [Suillus clintonianus]KAG2109479.1 hypothetical protein DEU56DRAFT_258800 [Suillus clintonianus]
MKAMASFCFCRIAASSSLSMSKTRWRGSLGGMWGSLGGMWGSLVGARLVVVYQARLVVCGARLVVCGARLVVCGARKGPRPQNHDLLHQEDHTPARLVCRAAGEGLNDPVRGLALGQAAYKGSQ